MLLTWLAAAAFAPSCQRVPYHCRALVHSPNSLARARAVVAAEPSWPSIPNVTAAIENTVRGVTGDDDYQFGDFTKGKVKELTGKDPSQYKFGDITKKAVSDFTGKDPSSYEFGDLTRAALGKADAAIGDARDQYFNELPTALWRQVFGGLTVQQRTDVIIAICQVGAVAMLSLALVNSLLLSLQSVVAWAIVCARTGLSPLASTQQWSAYLGTLATIRLGIDVPTLPVRVLAACFVTLRYRDVTNALQRRLPLRDEQPVLNRLLAIGVAWAGINCMAVGSATAVVMWIASLALRVPVFG